MGLKYILILGSVLSFLVKPVQAAEPSLNFSPADKTVIVKEQFTIDVMVDTVGYSIGGAGVKIVFDPNKLAVIKIEPGAIFSDYPSLIFDNNEGKMTISAISASMDELFTGQGKIATIQFEAKNSGETKVDFEFVPGRTTDSNLAAIGETGDVLGQVNQLKVLINEPLRSQEPTLSKLPDLKAINNWVSGLMMATPSAEPSPEVIASASATISAISLAIIEPVSSEAGVASEAEKPKMIDYALVILSGAATGISWWWWWRKS